MAFCFLFCDGTTLLTDMVIGCLTEACHDFISDTAQAGSPHIVEDVRDAPCVFFPTNGHEEWAGLLAVYHRRVGYGVGIVRVPIEHLMGSVVQASVYLLAMCSVAVSEVAFESVVFFLVHERNFLIIITNFHQEYCLEESELSFTGYWHES